MKKSAKEMNTAKTARKIPIFSLPRDNCNFVYLSVCMSVRLSARHTHALGYVKTAKHAVKPQRPTAIRPIHDVAV